jgi:hypothetical protein
MKYLSLADVMCSLSPALLYHLFQPSSLVGYGDQCSLPLVQLLTRMTKSNVNQHIHPQPIKRQLIHDRAHDTLIISLLDSTFWTYVVPSTLIPFIFPPSPYKRADLGSSKRQASGDNNSKTVRDSSYSKSDDDLEVVDRSFQPISCQL